MLGSDLQNQAKKCLDLPTFALMAKVGRKVGVMCNSWSQHAALREECHHYTFVLFLLLVRKDASVCELKSTENSSDTSQSQVLMPPRLSQEKPGFSNFNGKSSL